MWCLSWSAIIKCLSFLPIPSIVLLAGFAQSHMHDAWFAMLKCLAFLPIPSIFLLTGLAQLQRVGNPGFQRVVAFGLVLQMYQRLATEHLY